MSDICQDIILATINLTCNSDGDTVNSILIYLETRLISGSVKSTSINAMYALTHNMPITTELEQALIQYKKIIRLPNTDVWEKYPKTRNNLKTQTGLIQKIKEIKEKLDIPSQRENLQINNNPL